MDIIDELTGAIEVGMSVDWIRLGPIHIGLRIKGLGGSGHKIIWTTCYGPRLPRITRRLNRLARGPIIDKKN